MNRRSFLKLAACTAILGPEIFFNQKKLSTGGLQYNQNFSINQQKLLGLKTPKLYGDNYKLRKLPAEAFADMREDAKKEGIKLYSTSSHRNFKKQQILWNNRFEKYYTKGFRGKKLVNKILETVAIPGTSRHHWGTEVDITDLSKKQPENFFDPKNWQEGGTYNELMYWLKSNASKYGFHQAYTNNKERTGFIHEPWHWSFAELSIPLLEQYMKTPVTQYLNNPKTKAHNYFSRQEICNYKNNYMLGITPKLISINTMTNT